MRRSERGRITVAEIMSEALIGRLADWGVDTVFGLPGDGINGIMEGLRRQPSACRPGASWLPIYQGRPAAARPGRSALPGQGLFPPPPRDQAGVMLAFRWNMLSGSYSALIRASRSYLAAP